MSFTGTLHHIGYLLLLFVVKLSVRQTIGRAIKNVIICVMGGVIDPGSDGGVGIYFEARRYAWWGVALIVTGAITTCMSHVVNEFWRVYWNPDKRTEWITWYTEKCGVYLSDARRLKSSFIKELVIEEPIPSPLHSHGVAAGLRTVCEMALEKWISINGYEKYTVSCSTRDSGAGYHQYFMPRDLSHGSKKDKVLGNHIIKMVDVDYYVSLKRWLQYCRPIVMYTFVPDKAAGNSADAQFHFDGDEVIYKVNGGASFKHPLWNYGSDFLVVDYWWGSLFCYLETRHVGEDRRLVTIIPFRKVFGPIAWLLGSRDDRLSRLQVAKNGGYSVLQMTRDNLPWVSVGLKGAPLAMEMPWRMFHAMRVRFVEASKPNIGDVERLLNTRKAVQPTAAEDASMWFEFLKLNHTVERSTHLVKGGTVKEIKRPRSYQVIGDADDGYSAMDDGRASGRILPGKIVTQDAVVPRESRNNDQACVVGRIDKVRNTVVPSDTYLAYAKEFTRLVVPVEGVGSPWSADEVEVDQNRPMQRIRAEMERAWLSTGPAAGVTAFQKKESYGSVSDPRNISTVKTKHTMMLSGFTYAFKNMMLKHLPWYAPGKSPIDIAMRLADLAFQNDIVSETDYSRFDGTISVWLRRNIEQAIYLRWAHPCYRDELRAMLDNEITSSARTKFGIKYNPAGSRLSGSPLTTDGNTLMNAFTSYCALREVGQRPGVAYSNLGTHAGDDGVTPASGKVVEAVAKDLGLDVKLIERKRGEPVKFLGRVFLDPWTRITSIQDPVRTMKKLHISFTAPSVPDKVALLWRAKGYLALDPQAPVVSQWCRTVLGLLHVDGVVATEAHERACLVDQPYFATQLAKFDGNTWPQPPKGDDLAIGVVADECGVTPCDVTRWMEQLKDVCSWEDLAACDGMVQTTLDVKLAVVCPEDPFIMGGKPAGPRLDGLVKEQSVSVNRKGSNRAPVTRVGRVEERNVSVNLRGSNHTPLKPTKSTSSGYSTGSHPSSRTSSELDNTPARNVRDRQRFRVRVNRARK